MEAQTQELPAQVSQQPSKLCRACRASMSDDQRYCLECGARNGELPDPPAVVRSQLYAPESPTPRARGRVFGVTRDPNTAALAGVACLLLALGVGVLIGRAGRDSQTAPGPPQVISLGGTGASNVAATPVGDDWPAGQSGYTVQLQALPVTATQAGAVDAAKSSATAKGARAVGVLKSDDHGLPPGSYVIYSGIYPKQAQAAKALKKLAANFPGAAVVKVAPAAGGGSSVAAPAASAGAGATPSAPAPSKAKPPAAVKQLQSLSGKDYVKQSKKLPKTVATGGKPPPKDNKPAGGGSGFQSIGP